MRNPVFNLAVHGLKLVYREKVNPVCVCARACLRASWCVSLWADTESCTEGKDTAEE